MIRSALASLVKPLRGAPVAIPTLRRLMNVGARVFYPPRDVETEKFRIGQIPAEWIIPQVADHNKVILYFHGGGYAVGGTQTHRSLVGAIAKKTGFCALLPEYRLAPEDPFPAAVQDAVQCYRWLLDTGHAPEDIIIAGDSAGGGLSLACMLDARDKGLPMPSASFLIAPWVDLTISQSSVYENIDKSPILYLREMHAWAKNYAGDFPTDHPLVSPLFADLTGLPPLLIQVSDTEVLLDEDTLLARRAAEAGVEVDLRVWSNLMHVWHIYWRYLSHARGAIDEIGTFVAKHSPAEVTRPIAQPA
ncbi:MAG: alpha/beta hydrolase [Bacteroidota bacterium]